MGMLVKELSTKIGSHFQESYFYTEKVNSSGLAYTAMPNLTDSLQLYKKHYEFSTLNFNNNYKTYTP